MLRPPEGHSISLPISCHGLCGNFYWLNLWSSISIFCTCVSPVPQGNSLSAGNLHITAGLPVGREHSLLAFWRDIHLGNGDQPLPVPIMAAILETPWAKWTIRLIPLLVGLVIAAQLQLKLPDYRFQSRSWVIRGNHWRFRRASHSPKSLTGPDCFYT